MDGVIDAAKHILAIIDDRTKVIPGHGPLSTKADLAAYVEMLESLRNRVARLIAQGKTLQEVQESGVSNGYDTEWGDGFLPPAKFIRILYEDLSKATSYHRRARHRKEVAMVKIVGISGSIYSTRGCCGRWRKWFLKGVSFPSVPLTDVALSRIHKKRFASS